MDRPLSALVSGECWTGLLQSGEPSQKPLCFTSAHGEVVHAAWSLPTNSKIMIYQAKHSWVNGISVLMRDTHTQWIQVPADEELDWSSSKEVCAGLGCIGLAATYMGHRTVASMEWNPCIAAHLQRVTHGEVLVGDVNLDRDQPVFIMQVVQCVASF